MKKVSVTEVLSLVQDFSGVPAHVLGRAAERGKVVHKFIELNLMPENLDVWEVPEECVGYTKAWDMFHKFLKNDFSVAELIPEREIESPALNMVGHPDLMVVTEQGGAFVIDYKTTLVTHQPVHELQLAAYWHLARMNFPSHDFGNGSDSGVLYLGKDGDFSFWQPWNGTKRSLETALNEFTTLLKAYRIKEAINERSKSRSS